MSPKEKTLSLLAALAATTVAIEVEGFGTVQVREVTVAESDQIAKIARDNAEGSPSEFGLNLLIRSVQDEDGNPMFDDADLPALRACAGNKVDVLVGRVLEVNKFKKAADSKNLLTTPIASSDTA
jgi:hypothetical protein